jgi:hypothetical protein
MRIAFALSALAAVSACGPNAHEAEIARNRSLATIERACMRKAEARLLESERGTAICGPSDVECRPRFLASESQHCQCANQRISAEFTDAELATIAQIELLEAQMQEISAREASFAMNSDYQSLTQRHQDILADVSTAEDRRRLFWASAEAGRACRAAAYESITQ